MRKVVTVIFAFAVVIGVAGVVSAKASTISHSYRLRTESCSYKVSYAVDGRISVETWNGSVMKDTNYNSGFTSNLSCSEFCLNSDRGYHAGTYKGLIKDGSYGWDY